MRPALHLAALTLALGVASARGGSDAPRIGVLVPKNDAEAAEAARSFETASNLAGRGAPTTFVERAAAPGETATAAALGEMRGEAVDVVVAVGDAATARVAGTMRDRPVVLVGADPAAAEDLRGGGNACVVAAAAPDAVVQDLRRGGLVAKRVGVYVRPGDEAAAANARDLRAVADVVIVDAAAKIPSGLDVVWLAPSVSAADAAAFADAMQRGGVALVGSRKDHFDAGCAVVVRCDPRDLGETAALVAKQVLGGADPAKIPVRRLRRRLLEVNLPAAARLGWRVPTSLLAWADSVRAAWKSSR